MSKAASAATPCNEAGYISPSEARAGLSLPSRDRLRCLHRQLQHLAQCRQILGTWPCATHFPEVDARSTHPDTLGNLCNRQAALDASVAKVATQTWLTRQRSTSQLSGYSIAANLASICVHGKT